KWGNWDYNYELVFQLGTLGPGNIYGLGAASDTGYTFAKAKFTPRLGIRGDLTSGDKNRRDPDSETFSPLFPELPMPGRSVCWVPRTSSTPLRTRGSACTAGCISCPRVASSGATASRTESTAPPER